MGRKSIDSRPAGLGDLMVGLWIAEGARRTGERILMLDDGRGDVVRAFGHEVGNAATEECMVLGTGTDVYGTELRTSYDDRSPRTLRWQRSLDWNFTPTRPPYIAQSDEALAWARSMTEGRPTVIFAPRSAYDCRSAPMQKWLRVAWSLHEEGVKTIAIDGSREAVEAFPLFAFGFGWNHIMALISQASVVVGNDSGIAHLSATMGVPTIAAMGPTDPNIVFGHCLDVLTPVTAEGLECSGCHFSHRRGYQVACDHGCEALQTISWKRLRHHIDTALANRKEPIPN